MKFKTLLFIIAVQTITIHSYGQETLQQKFKKLEWLTGKWNRTNNQSGQSGYETWSKINDQKLSGKGVTLEKGKAVFVENLEISIKGNDIFYVVSINEEKKGVPFKFTEITANGFTCENPQHDFPKKITYRRDGKKVKATISGNGKQVDYYFVSALPVSRF